MNENSSKSSILLIDDESEPRARLEDKLCKILSNDNVVIRSWQPTIENHNPLVEFEKHIDNQTLIVATDYDLTGEGMKGLFGHTIVGWCQQRLIPVGDFSRANKTALPTRPSLFELRIPPSDTEGARFIASAFRGFRKIRYDIAEASQPLASKTSLAAVLAALLGRPQLDSHFSLYMSRLGTGNSALVEHVSELAKGNTPEPADKIQLLCYVLGHVLLNVILRFPGPILSERALCAYLATSEAESDDLQELFKNATYKGPFEDDGSYFWREEVDMVLEDTGSGSDFEGFGSFGDYNRAMAEWSCPDLVDGS